MMWKKKVQTDIQKVIYYTVKKILNIVKQSLLVNHRLQTIQIIK